MSGTGRMDAWKHRWRFLNRVCIWCTRRMSLPDFQTWDLWILGVVLALSGFFYGVSLEQRFQATKPVFGVLPDEIWQIGFIISGILLLIGLVLRMHRVTWLGAGLLTTAYVSFTIGLIIDEPNRWMFVLSRSMVQIALAGLGWMRLGYDEPDDGHE